MAESPLYELLDLYPSANQYCLDICRNRIFTLLQVLDSVRGLVVVYLQYLLTNKRACFRLLAFLVRLFPSYESFDMGQVCGGCTDGDLCPMTNAVVA